jgi:hypothetical protein
MLNISLTFQTKYIHQSKFQTDSFKTNMKIQFNCQETWDFSTRFEDEDFETRNSIRANQMNNIIVSTNEDLYEPISSRN